MTPDELHNALRSSPGLVLSGDMLDTALKAAAIAALNRRRHGLPDDEYVALVRACETALTESGKSVTCARFDSAPTFDVSANGHHDTGAAPHWVSTHEAAQRLGCSPRTARRIAQKVGHRIGRDWLIPADALPQEEQSA